MSPTKKFRVYDDEEALIAVLKGPVVLRELLRKHRDRGKTANTLDQEDLIGRFLKEPSTVMWYEIGFLWECDKSPFGLCLYHHMNDYAHDNCIFCHEPEERK